MRNDSCHLGSMTPMTFNEYQCVSFLPQLRRQTGRHSKNQKQILKIAKMFLNFHHYVAEI